MRKHTLIGLALLLTTAFACANAEAQCSGVTLTNGTGSPPVVTGNTINYWTWGPSPSFYHYIDGAALLITDPNPYNPPGAFFSMYWTTSGLTYGNHTMWTSWEGCVLNFSNVAPPPPSQIVDTVNVTAGASGAAWGFWAGNWGSVSPTVTSNGKTYYAIADNYNGWGGVSGASFSACGFSSNPGAGWLTSIAKGSTTKLASQASYSYASGCAYWAWSNGNIGLPYGGGAVTQVTVTHY